MSRLLLLLAASLSLFAVRAQEADTTKSRSTIFGLPLVFYTPETRWGFGAAGFYSFRFEAESDTSRPSQIQLGGAYTLEDQTLLYLPYRLWWNENRYSLFGELGWYRYNYYFYGVGNGNPPESEELYGVNYPRLRLSLIRRIIPHLYGGINVVADDFVITETDPAGVLSEGNIPGSTGGLNAGVGILLNYDSRDNIFETHEGWYAELIFNRFDEIIGSDFEYDEIRFDLRKYFTLSKNDFLAARFYTQSISGDAPFMSQALLGGTKLMRGLYEGRYRDDRSAVIQTEYRRDLFGRFGAVAFLSVGAVADNYGDLSLRYLRNTYGAGLRFALNREDRINIRFDVGIGQGEPAYYLTIGEAF